jgi:adenylate cyclase
MTEERAKRKLSGILSADAVGYSRLMEDDEASTIRTLEDSKRLMSELIEQFKGRVVDAPGDNLLAEFGSVVDATECAVQIQQELKIRNADLPDNLRMEFRIGVNLGDVVEEADRIYGDGVNIAARIEGLAESGGICISRTAYDHVKNKLALGYEYLGEHRVKNIAEPVRVYRVLTEPEAAGKVIGEKRFLGRISRKTAMAAIIILVIVAGGLIGWNIYLQQSKKVEPASLDKMAFPLPDKPSIAVLAFDNLSGDPKQEYFSDGITEEIITALSKVQRLFVIARNSTFTYKGKPVKVQQVGRELGVRYVLEGSVRKSADKVRITAQLIDATTDNHVWAERYDRDLKDVFAIQDEITLEITKAMQVELTEGERARVTGRGTKNLDAYLKAIQAHEQMRGTHNKENSLRVRQLAMEAISLDPHYGYPYAILSQTHLRDKWLPSTESPEESMRLATDAAQKALALDDSDHRIHITWGFLYVNQGKYDKAVAAAQRAVELCPGGADAYKVMGIALDFACRTNQAIPMFEKAIKLNPLPDPTLFYLLAAAYQWVGRYEDAIIEGKKALQLNPNNALTHFVLVRAYTKLGRKEEARAEAAEVLRINPKFSLDWYFKMVVKMMPTECHSEFYDDIEFVRKADVGLK